MAKEPKKTYPEHGDEYEEDEEALEPNEEDQEGEEDAPEDQKEPPEPKKDSLEERLARIEGENAALRAAIARPQDIRLPEKVEEPEPDWEKLMYDDPKGFVNTLSGRIAKQVSSELGNKYQKDQGEKDFWNEFYDENSDLKEDRDLVQATLTRNINILGDLPVSQARKKLADLTRERIMGYKRERKDDATPKVRVEGARSPKAPKKAAEDNKIVTLSDIIRSRRAKRMKAQTA